MQAPAIRDFEAHERFRATARRLSLDPDSVWVGGYVENGWRHGRHVFECAGLTVAGASVLEFGCNVGATSIVLATMGAVVTGVDVNRDFVELAGLNAASYGFAHAIELLHAPDTRRGFGPAYSDAGLLDRGAGYLEARRRMGVSAARRMLLRTAIRVLAPLRLSVGLLTPTICLQLRKDGGIAPGAARDS